MLSRCDTPTTKSDLDNCGATSYVTSFCRSHYKTNPDRVTVNSNNFGYESCIIARDTEFSSLKPTDVGKVIAEDSFTNSSDEVVEHEFRLSSKFGDSMTLQTTNSISTMENKKKYDVKIPSLFEAHFRIDKTMTTDDTSVHTASSSTSYSSSTVVKVPPGCSVTNKLVAKVKKYYSDFSTPICIDGYVGCDFPKKVEDPDNKSEGKHYQWYVPMLLSPPAAPAAFFICAGNYIYIYIYIYIAQRVAHLGQEESKTTLLTAL